MKSKRNVKAVQLTTSPLRVLREARGVSQRTLSESAGISRGRLRRLEEGRFQEATFAELSRLAGALGVDVREFFRGTEINTHGTHLTRAGEQGFEMKGNGAGYRIVSYLPPRPDLFAGKIFISPRKKWPSAETPRAGTIFLQMMLGTLRVAMGSESYHVEEGDSFVFHGDTPYALENPLLREAVGFVVTIPVLKTN